MVLACGLPFLMSAPAGADTETETDTATAVLKPGDRGASVTLLQQRLHDRGYYHGKINGVYDEQTMFAIWALQKSNRLRPNGAVGPEVWKALEEPAGDRPMVPNGGANRVEIDLRDQLLTVYRHNRPVLVSHISSGSQVPYCLNGHCGNAITPVGDFRVTRRAPGWTTGPLGPMYNSLYFVGGVAIHGATRVPAWPASHGCVRLPLAASKRLYELVGVGDRVYVRGKIYKP
ncbi:lipoprotein-anchoring transpeptidase ErfK/SrfK [Nonomuraea polychroma]|uniref:Lipoprotein-anchoring transpeptidase ErfK/SrfK n=2 Tax=Nonomuraea polychroma TaxID=46176 RepID=A0A438MNS1_9ACTN|nr:lipoprotein-anchoring transpeptidase ErfK/SrfK [Nonomuraea polychroma]